MKTMKKVMVLLLIAVLAIAPCSTTFAANSSGATGTITVENPQVNQTYTAYKIFDVTYDDNDGTNDNYSYTIKSSSPWFSTVSAYAGTLSSGVYSGGGNGLTLTPVAGTSPTVYVASVTSSFSAADFAETLKSASVSDTNAVTLTNGSASGLALGYWFVTTNTGSLCNLTTTNPTVTIHDKNEPLTLDKTVNDEDNTVYLGQVLTFKVTAKLPADVTGYSTYIWDLSDTMSDGLDFRCIESIKIGTTTYDTTASISSLAARSGFTYLHSGIDATSNSTTPTNGFKFTIDLATKDNDGNLVWADILGKTVEVTYRAIVTEDAIESASDTNKAVLKYSNDPNDSSKYTEVTKEISLYSLNIDLTKVDADNQNTKLAGAQFVLYKLDNSTKKYYAIDDSGDYDTVKWVSLNSYADVTAALEDNSDFCVVGTSNASGEIKNVFKGLDAGTYYLEEIKAPLGYNLPASPFTVVLTKSVDQTTEAVSFTATLDSASMSVNSSDLTASGTITNGSGTLFPSTGGVGTTIFYVLGGFLLIGAAVLLLIRKRAKV